MLLFFCFHLSVYSDDEDTGGFYMRVENGSRPNNGTTCPNGIITQVTLTCDQSKKWEGQDISSFVKVAYNHLEPCSVSRTLLCE